jgi:hypothetical protein
MGGANGCSDHESIEKQVQVCDEIGWPYQIHRAHALARQGCRPNVSSHRKPTLRFPQAGREGSKAAVVSNAIGATFL